MDLSYDSEHQGLWGETPNRPATSRWRRFGRCFLATTLLLLVAAANSALVFLSPPSFDDAGFNNFCHNMALSLQWSEVSLAAIWLGVGRTWTPLRLLGMIFAYAFWWVAREANGGMEMLVSAAYVCLPLLVARFCGMELDRLPPKPETRPVPRSAGILRRSGRLLVWSVSVLMLAFAIRTAGFGSGHTWPAPCHLFGSRSAAPAAIALAAVWSLLGTRWRCLRVAMPVVVCLCVAAYNLVLDSVQMDGDDAFHFADGVSEMLSSTAHYRVNAFNYLASLIPLFGVLLAVRIAGYRLFFSSAQKKRFLAELSAKLPTLPCPWYQFSLSALLLSVLVLAIPCSWLAVKIDRARRQRECVEVILKGGGSVKYDCQIKSWRNRTTNGEPSWPRWLRQLLGDDFFRDVIVAEVKSADGIEHLERLRQLEQLYLWGMPLTDSGLGKIQGMHRLGLLNIGSTKVTDAGMVHLTSMSQLRVLDIDNTQITDAGLVHLEGLSGLRLLLAGNSRITDKGVQSLRQSIPHCEVVR